MAEKHWSSHQISHQEGIKARKPARDGALFLTAKEERLLGWDHRGTPMGQVPVGLGCEPDGVGRPALPESPGESEGQVRAGSTSWARVVRNVDDAPVPIVRSLDVTMN